MTKISRLTVDPQRMGSFLNTFWSLITLLEDKAQVRVFLSDLLTHTEMKMLAKRVSVAKMLLEGSSYEEIRRYVKVTDATIAKMSNLLNIGATGLVAAIHKFQKIEQKAEDKKFSGSSIEEKYGLYFIPEKIVGGVAKELSKMKKRNSVKR